MSESENDRKRRASEQIDATAVNPKKRLLAAQVAESPVKVEVKEEEAASPKPSANGAPASAPQAAANTKAEVKTESGEGHSTSFSIRDNAPAGVHGADSEETLKFQNTQLYAAHQASKNEIARLEGKVKEFESIKETYQRSTACIYRHWSVLTEELKSTFQRLEHTPSDIDTAGPRQVFDSIMALQTVVPEEVDTGFARSCQVAQELMQEVVQSLMDVNARQKSLLSTLEEKSADETLKSELQRVTKLATSAEKDLVELQAQHAKYIVEEGKSADDAKIKAGNVSTLQGEVENLKEQLVTVERRLVRSEENFRNLQANGSSGGATGEGGKTGGGADDNQLADYKHQAESRLTEIKALQEKVLSLQEHGSSTSGGSDLSEEAVVQSAPYLSLLEQVKQLKKETEQYHVPKIQQLNAELQESRERIYEERQKMAEQHNNQVRQVQARLSMLTNQLLESKQEVRSLQFKLDQKSSCEMSKKRADELEQTLTKLQEEYKRLRTEHEELKAKPDTEELRREFREKEEKIYKERDAKEGEVNSLMEQLRSSERKLSQLMQERAANGAAGDEALKKEIENQKVEIAGLRTDKKDLQRRLQKADRGFNDCNKLYQQVKKEKDALMKDLESLGMSFEEMQEQNTRLLESIKQRDEEHNDQLRQRMKEKQNNAMLSEEKSTLKARLEKAEEMNKAREDAVEKCKIDMEQQRQEYLKKQKEDETGAAVILEYRKHMQQRDLAAKDARREAEKAKATLSEYQKEHKTQSTQLQEARFDNNRLKEEIDSMKRSLNSQKMDKETNGMDASHKQLLQFYRSRVKCHCTQHEKTRCLPCGHALCQNCVETLIKDRSRKCPSCGKKFDQADVRPLFLQGSVDES